MHIVNGNVIIIIVVVIRPATANQRSCYIALEKDCDALHISTGHAGIECLLTNTHFLFIVLVSSVW